MALPKYSRSREKFINDNADKWAALVVDIQTKLNTRINNFVIRELDREDGMLVSSRNNITIAGKLDKLYEDFMKTQGAKMVKEFLAKSKDLADLNQKYFSGVSELSPQELLGASAPAIDKTYLNLGIDPEEEDIIAQGPLDNIFRDTRPIQGVKNIIASGVIAGTALGVIEGSLTDNITGGGTRRGSFQGHFDSAMGDPYQSFDRQLQNNIGTDLGFNYFIYQGGTVRDSRDFCLERNDRVFTRAEIDAFGTPGDIYGGYTNKSAGEFQGKTRPYNPWTDLGGYNCRHKLDAISDELAFALRPELRTPQ